jgi:TonB family protein
MKKQNPSEELPDRDLTRAEEQVMQLLWRHEKALVHDILSEFPEPRPAYTTVSTIIRILEEKGFVGHKAYGRTHEYYPLISKKDYTKRYFRQMISNYFGNSYPSLASFFTSEENLSLGDLEEIRNLIDKEIKNRILMMTKPRSHPLAKSKLAIALPVVLAVMVFFAGNSMNIKAYAQNGTGTPGTATVLTPPHPSPQHQASVQERQGNSNDTIYEKVEKEPEYPGGNDALLNFMLQNLKYPELAREKKTMGTVFVYFVVRADGSVDNVRIKRGVGNGCDEEAIRVVRLLPKWVPGEDHGKKVNVSFYLPIQFKLPPDKQKK